MAKRENGYYWVKMSGTWLPLEWNNDWYEEFGTRWDNFHDDEDMEEINETRIKSPDELKPTE